MSDKENKTDHQLVQKKVKKCKLPVYDGVLKDLNFIEMNVSIQHKQLNFLDLAPLDRELLLETLEKDSLFLKEFELMDYSVYLAVEKTPRGFDRRQNYGRNVFISSEGNEIYHIGLIDYLQLWDSRKIIENCLKSRVLGRDNQSLSAVHPDLY